VSERNAHDGFVLVDKPPEWTSFDAVRWVRKAFPGEKVGHAGTLDPFATGLLILLVGKATRLMQYLEGYRKEYEGEMLLGVDTDTSDPSGTVTRVTPQEQVEALSEDRIREEFAHWTGEVEQVPPAFSAVRVRGERAYKKARRGEETDLEPRDVEIHRLELVRWEPPRALFCSSVGTGTYLRSLARDVGEGLGVGGHLIRLRRTAVGFFRVEEAYPLQGEERSGHIRDRLRPMVELLPAGVRIEITAAQARRVMNGNELRMPAESVRYAEESSYVGVVSRQELVAVGYLVVVGADGIFKPRTVLALPRFLEG
jgi:tRNA pseudouridine55 synthase